ncbi:phage antirepressor N-terminal domain-containing protein [Mannheimia pernigra]|uniref:P22_AR N-terminal domain-containing protein n=1 Tax=Mannheimia pernigra TaxID=111844 RepID=A0A7D5HXA3_9PAST|nr:phage antirepressor N-terminal domain-containing protein [Mannheimia pernigra]QLB40790.1 hypothetical protein HV559_07860 [Mannheimia pernigra]
MSNQLSTQTISFYGSELITLKLDDVIYTAVRPIVEALGLSWGSQQRKLENSKGKFSCTHMKTTGSDGKTYEMLCMPLKKLNGWLFSINPEKVRPDLKEKVIRYQEECFEALYNYWHFGKAERKTTVNERTGLRDAVNMLVSKKGLIYSEAYQMVHQRFNVQSIEDLSQEQLPMAVEYVHKICLEGELIINEPEKMYQFSERELWTLAWAWKAGERMRCILKELYAPLEKIGCRYSGAIYGSVTEYQRTLDEARQIIMRETEHIKTDPWENRDWFNVLYELRRGKLNNPI